MLFNKICPSIFEKNKAVCAHERHTVQLISVLNRNVERDIINSFECCLKTHSNLNDKRFIPLYVKHLHFLIKIAGQLVTKIYKHHMFEKTKFKQYFVQMNQKALKKSTSLVERNFCKLLNNVNFGTDYRNNIHNCKLKRS